MGQPKLSGMRKDVCSMGVLTKSPPDGGIYSNNLKRILDINKREKDITQNY